MRFALSELEALPTLCVSQADDLKVEVGPLRVWLSRCGVEDGEPYPNKVTHEERDDDGRWHITAVYEAIRG